MILITGLPGTGKTTIAKKLAERIQKSIVIDGDDIRKDLCFDLGFSDDDRFENVRRAACLSRILKDQGFYPICSMVAPKPFMRDIFFDFFKKVYHIELFCDDNLILQRRRCVDFNYMSDDINLPFSKIQTNERDATIICDEIIQQIQFQSLMFAGESS